MFDSTLLTSSPLLSSTSIVPACTRLFVVIESAEKVFFIIRVGANKKKNTGGAIVKNFKVSMQTFRFEILFL